MGVIEVSQEIFEKFKKSYKELEESARLIFEKVGEWVIDKESGLAYCPFCNKTALSAHLTPYCSNCGAALKEPPTWVKDGTGLWRCPQCKELSIEKTIYCAKCGIKLEG